MDNIIDILTTKITKYLANINISDVVLNIKEKNKVYTINGIYQIEKLHNITFDKFAKEICSKLSDEEYNFVVSGKNINIHIREQHACSLIDKYNELSQILKSPEKKLRMIFDYPSPNIAKNMHVGHLRSSIIGDSLANLYSELGHQVSRINHIGDIGLHFGLIITYIMENNIDDYTNINEIYCNSKKIFDQNEEFKKKSYETLIKLQRNQDDEILKIWKRLCEGSLEEQNKIYGMLSIKNLTNIGESYYYKYFDDLIKELKEKSLLVCEDNRHVIKFLKMPPLTIIKSDGGYTYDTTDLAALRYRLVDCDADHIYYVVDSGQELHFKQIFEVAKLMNWLTSDKQVIHINFGIVKGKDNKKLRTRNGDNESLMDLLQDSVIETKKVFELANNKISQDDIHKVSYGSLKFADLINNRQSDYVFSFEKLLDFKGKTLTYVMYSFVRLNSIFEKILKYTTIDNYKTNSTELIQTDYDIINHVLKFPIVINYACQQNMIHFICIYLFEMAELISTNYKKLKCIELDTLKENIANINRSRINVFLFVFKIYKLCFKILGINEIYRM